MTKAIITAASALALAATPAAAQANIEGHWTNPKHTTLVHVTRCDGNAYCAIVLKASGKAFDPESNMHVPATVRFVSADTIEIQGCALFGLICKTQRWTKAD
jgi:uncharacterized protein (DUF2147 family)